MQLLTAIFICEAVFLISGLLYFKPLTLINALRPYALFIVIFVFVAMSASLLYVRNTTITTNSTLLASSVIQPAETRGFPISILTTTAENQTTTSFSGQWRRGFAASDLFDEAFYFCIALIFVGIYAGIKGLRAKGAHKT